MASNRSPQFPGSKERVDLVSSRLIDEVLVGVHVREDEDGEDEDLPTQGFFDGVPEGHGGVPSLKHWRAHDFRPVDGMENPVTVLEGVPRGLDLHAESGLFLEPKGEIDFWGLRVRLGPIYREARDADFGQLVVDTKFPLAFGVCPSVVRKFGQNQLLYLLSHISFCLGVAGWAAT